MNAPTRTIVPGSRKGFTGHKTSIKWITLAFILAILLGFTVSIRLSEEKRTRFLRALREAREMPYRIFV